MPRRTDPERQRVYYNTSEELLKVSGGRRVNIRLLPPAAEKLDELMKRWRVKTMTEAIHQAIMQAR